MNDITILKARIYMIDYEALAIFDIAWNQNPEITFDYPSEKVFVYLYESTIIEVTFNKVTRKTTSKILN
jgi:hypothetical protein